MLKHIPKTFTPDLLRLIMEMGHGEELLISDANFPWRSAGCEHIYVPVDSVGDLLKDILYFFPLDKSRPSAALVMESAMESGVFHRYERLLAENEDRTLLETAGRFQFYERARNAVGIVVTADTVKGGNILIAKGTVVG